MHHSDEWLPELSPCLLHLNQVIPVYLCIVREEGEGTSPMNSAYFFSLYLVKSFHNDCGHPYGFNI